MLGRVLGVGIGFAATNDAVGAVTGFLLGFVFDWHFENVEKPMRKGDGWDTEFSYLFVVLHAKFAKMDGKVTPDEIRAFQEVVSVSAKDLNAVREIYNLHRKTSDGFESIAVRLSEMLAFEEELKKSVVQSLCLVLYMTGQETNLYQNAFIQAVARILTLDGSVLEALMKDTESHVRASFDSFEGKESSYDLNWKVSDTSYQVLGLKPGVSHVEIKKAYKKAIRQYHPDKVRGQGGSEKDVKRAELKMLEINKAYDDLMQS